jgi:hypothetical protein
MTSYVAALTGAPLLALDCSVPIEEARQRVAYACGHFPQGTHFAASSETKTIAVILCNTYRVACWSCGEGIDCSCGRRGCRLQGCTCTDSALDEDRTSALCQDCDYPESDEDGGSPPSTFRVAGHHNHCASCGRRCCRCHQSYACADPRGEDFNVESIAY